MLVGQSQQDPGGQNEYRDSGRRQHGSLDRDPAGIFLDVFNVFLLVLDLFGSRRG
jgi:hypothetical protein